MSAAFEFYFELICGMELLLDVTRFCLNRSRSLPKINVLCLVTLLKSWEFAVLWYCVAW